MVLQDTAPALRGTQCIKIHFYCILSVIFNSFILMQLILHPALGLKHNITTAGTTTYLPTTAATPPTTTPAKATPFICPNSIYATTNGKKTASVSWLTPYGVKTNAELPVGEYKFHYVLDTGSDCYFFISVADSSGLCFQCMFIDTADVRNCISSLLLQFYVM